MQAKVTLLHCTTNPEQVIELAGRTAHRSTNKITKHSAKQFCQLLKRLGHESVFEHAYASFQLENVSRSLTHQLVRHRLASYTQESQRYVKQDGFSYITPPSLKDKLKGLDAKLRSKYRNYMLDAASFYKRLIESGIPKEDARYIIPNAASTKIVVTANFRQWRHMLKLRGSLHAQWEIREVFVDILRKLWKIAPNVFDDFQVELRNGQEYIIQTQRS